MSVFSSNVPGSFAAARTVPATAALVAEPSLLAIPRQSDHPTAHRPPPCPDPIVNVGHKLDVALNKISPLLDPVSKITTPITDLQSKITSRFTLLKSRILHKLGLSCAIPKLFHPFEPYFHYARCTLGLNDDGFMDSPPCNTSLCMNPKIETREITRDKGLPNLDFMMEGMVNTMDECFEDMEPVMYGSRIIAKLVDDVECKDPKYNAICKELMDQNRTVLEENCEMPK